MDRFFISVASSTTASIVVAILAWLTRRIWLGGFISDIAKVYTSKYRGQRAIDRDIAKSESVRILTIRGKSIVDIYPSLWDNDKTGRRIEIIVSRLDNDSVIQERSRANNTSIDLYKNEMSYAYNGLKLKRNKFGNLSIFLHKENPAFRLIILDEYLYVSHFLPEKNVNKSRLIRYQKSNGAYIAFLHYYETIKKHSAQAYVEPQEGASEVSGDHSL